MENIARALLLLSVLLLCCYLGGFVDCQMVPISEVKTHPPSPPSSDKSSESSKKSDGKPLDQRKIDIHKKIAAAHLREEEEADLNLGERAESFPSVETDSSGAKVVRRDKAPELQNPAKHASDITLLDFLLDQYKKITSSAPSLPAPDLELQLEILQNIQYFTHKYENGRDLFQATDALETILLPGLNSSYYEIRQSICSIFGVAGQNNEAVQESAMNSGVLRQLAHLINTDAMVRPKALYALSSLLRNFAAGQRKFIQDGGLQILVNAAFLSETRQKSLTLLIDLIKEQKYHADDSSGFENETTKLLTTNLKQSEWCRLLTDNLINLEGFGQDDQLLIIDALYYSSLGLNICQSTAISSFKSMFEKLLVKLEDISSEAEIDKSDEGSVEFHFVDEDLARAIQSLRDIISSISQSHDINNAQQTRDEF